jgi:predicted RNA-binding protein (virulence factor B family)
MVYENEVFQHLHIGQRLKGFIKTIRQDGKIDLSLQPSGHERVSDISQNILKAIRKQGGKLPLTDKSPAAEIYSLFGVSKKAFKKAIGALYKRRLISIETNCIKLAKNEAGPDKQASRSK